MLRALSEWRKRRAKARLGRLEPFGAIVQLQTPRALVFVDRAEAAWLGLGDDEDWDRWPAELDGDLGAVPLTAPLEAHLQLTNRCSAGCKGCYTAATPTGGHNELGLEAWKQAIDVLADMGAFHLALGGGESAELPWLGEIAEYARDRGLIPNLTTSGLVHLDRVIDSAASFGQINVSLDGMASGYQRVRGFDGFARADRAIVALRRVKREIGINVVVTRETFGDIDEMFAYAKKRKLNEVELLRFKPSGRGATAYDELRCTDEQHLALLPTVLAAARKHRVRVKLDCSYTPMIAAHEPSRELMAQLAVYGCIGGDFLVGAKANGTLSACSFAAPPKSHPKIGDLAGYWNTDDAFGAFRTWREAAEPCIDCRYHDLCRGGCKAVSRHVHGDEAAPDPECPRVRAHQASLGGDGGEPTSPGSTRARLRVVQ